MAPIKNYAMTVLALLSWVAPSLQQEPLANVLNFCSGSNIDNGDLAQLNFEYILVQDISLKTICKSFDKTFHNSCGSMPINCERYGSTVIFGVVTQTGSFDTAVDCVKLAFSDALQAKITDGDKPCSQLGNLSPPPSTPVIGQDPEGLKARQADRAYPIVAGTGENNIPKPDDVFTLVQNMGTLQLADIVSQTIPSRQGGPLQGLDQYVFGVAELANKLFQQGKSLVTSNQPINNGIMELAADSGENGGIVTRILQAEDYQNLMQGMMNFGILNKQNFVTARFRQKAASGAAIVMTMWLYLG